MINHPQKCVKQILAEMKFNHNWDPRKTHKICERRRSAVLVTILNCFVLVFVFVYRNARNSRDRSCLHRCRWGQIIIDMMRDQAAAEHTIPFVKAWITDLRSIVLNYPESVVEFRQLVLQCRRPFLDVWLQCNPMYLGELLGVYFILLEMDPPDAEYVSILFERSLQRTDELLRMGDLPRVESELLFAFKKWLLLIPNLSQRLAMTIGNADVSISPFVLELVGSALYKGIIVGGDWTVEQAQLFVERAVTMKKEKCIFNILSLCVTFMGNVQQVDKSTLNHLWDAIDKWNRSTVHSIGNKMSIFDKAVAIVDKYDMQIKDIWDSQIPMTERDNLIDNTGIIIWAAWCMRRESRVRSIVDCELKRLLPMRNHILPLPPSVANEVDVSSGSISKDDVLWCLRQHTKLEYFHEMLPDTWILSWTGYLILYDKLDGGVCSINWFCSDFVKWSTEFLELVAEERTWQFDQTECTIRRAKILSTALSCCDPIQVASDSGDKCLQWLFHPGKFQTRLRWHDGPTVYITRSKKSNNTINMQISNR